MKVAVLDLGLGNLLSIRRGFERAGAEVAVIESDKGIDVRADAVILPGVGAFRDGIVAMSNFNNTLEEVKAGEKTLLGVCLGMQMLFTKSYEGGEYGGLDLIKGEVVRLPDTVKVPHMGWNSVKLTKASRLTEGLKDEEYFYFVHSYYCRLDEDVGISETDYGAIIASMVEKGNVYGTQFHPEKSGPAGAKIIKNFLEASRR
jgi:glutamine amidotransferase